ncbi:SAV_2336 N-terminal domain-related protein [Streptomyces sp. NPDC059477]|uniref:SAV_2336 N-terminal domain-related protein n=1 Tax=Streptomyces sp. NPDC059477 TaxID=3346847 RepID=UPI0036955777
MTVAASLESLARRLHEAGLAPDAEELADALWLARHLPGTATSAPLPDTPADPSVPAPPGPSGAPPATPPEASLAVPAGPPGADRRPPDGPPPAAAPGAGPGAHSAAAVVSARVPTASVLPDPLALQRALRPLGRYRPPGRPPGGPGHGRVDEEATAERAADTGIVIPVPSPARRREARLQLVMDVSSSTVVWRDTLSELRQVCERAGAFSEVRVHYLHEGAGHDVRVSTSPDPAAPTSGPGLLRDPGGRRLTLVLSDCAGPLWRGGRMQRQLHAWASCAPLAVLQPLPQRMWRTTHLPAFSGELLRREGPAAGLEFRSERAGPRPAGALPVPVLALRPASLGNWVRLVCDATAQRLTASAAWVRPDHPPATRRPRATHDVDARTRVRAFRRTASQDARRLAEYLATVPLALPVMQVVQRAMLPASGPDAMAEVLLGGLLRRSDGVTDGGYEFIGGVREELLRHLPGGEAQLVLKHSSQYVERQYGRSARNFPALAAAYLSGAAGAPGGAEDGTDGQLLRAFARISSQVLARYGRAPTASPGTGPGELAARAHALLGRYAGQGTARDLDEGIGLLRRALDAERRADDRRALRGRLAEALLARWRAAGAADNLREAYEALPEPSESDTAGLLTEAQILLLIAADLETSGRAAAGVPAGLARDLGEPGAAPARLALLAYERVLRRLADLPPGTEPALADRGLALRAGAALSAASLIARYGRAALGPDEGDPQERAARWFTVAAGLATQHRLHDERPGARLFEARALLALARHTDARAGDSAELRDLAFRTAEAAEAAFRDALPLLAAEGTAAPELARVCLDTAEALELTGPARTDPGVRRSVVDVLQQALDHAAGDDTLRSLCFDRLGGAYLTTHGLTRAPQDLESAVWSWWQAAGALPLDDPARPALLHRLGLALGTAREWNDAIRVLRMAVDESQAHDPELPGHRVELGEALVRRFRDRGGLSDLHEADWILGTAARESDDGLLAARAWRLRADAARRLAERTGARSDLEDVPEHLLRAAELYRDLSLPAAEARIRVERATALTRAAAPARAAAEYRTALRLYRAAGLTDSQEATDARDLLDSVEWDGWGVG